VDDGEGETFDGKQPMTSVSDIIWVPVSHHGTHGLLGQIVKDDKSVLAVVSEPLGDRGTGEWSNVLKRSSLGGGGGNNDGVLHGVVLLKSLDELGDGGTLLTDGDVDTVELLLLVATVVETLLVEHGIKGDGGLSGLTVTNDQLTLTTADRNHCVDGLETGLDWLTDGLARKNTRGLELSTTLLGGLDWTLAIDRLSEGIYYTTTG